MTSSQNNDPRNVWDTNPRRDEHGDADSEHTRVLPVQDGGTGGAHPAPGPDSARVQSVRSAYDDRTPRTAPTPRPASDADIARRDPRGTAEWDYQTARLLNRTDTDLGLLLLRLCSLPLVLHGVRKATGFPGFVETLRGNPVGSLAPEIFALLVTAGQIVLPVLIAVGFLTRFAGLAQAVMMGAIYAFFVLANSPVLDPRTGGLSGEAALGFAAIALPLLFTGAGRFSLDHGLMAKSRERRIEKRATKRLSA